MQIYLRQFGVQTTVVLQLRDRGTLDILASPVVDAADVYLLRDSNAAVSPTNAPVVVGNRVYITLTASEMACKTLMLQIVDVSTVKSYEDTSYLIETYDDSNAQHPRLGSTTVWSSVVRTLTDNAVYTIDAAADDNDTAEVLTLIQKSSCSYPIAVNNLPVGATIVKAYLSIKENESDPDSSALLMKTITSAVTSSGQITDAGTDGIGQLVFTIDNDDLDACALNTLYQSAVKVILSTGAACALDYCFRPVLVVAAGVEAVI